MEIYGSTQAQICGKQSLDREMTSQTSLKIVADYVHVACCIHCRFILKLYSFTLVAVPPEGSDLVRSMGHMMPNLRGVWPTGRRPLIFHFMLLPVGVDLRAV